MDTISFVLFFIFGLIFGSFANVLLLRFHTGESLARGGSRCFSCAKRLRWFELIPLLSYIALRGKCRRCRSKISWQYPLVELGTGLLFLGLFWSSGIENVLKIENWKLIISIILIYLAWFFLWLAALYDFRHMVLPDRFLVIALLFAVAAFIAYSLEPTHYSLIGAVYQIGAAFLGFLFFFLLWAASRGKWMGLGDAKFSFVLGMLLPPHLLLTGIILSFFVGSIFSFILLVSKKAALKTAIPFGPFLFLGGLAAFVAGEKIIALYFELF